MRLSKLRNLNPSAIGHGAPWQLENEEIEAFFITIAAWPNPVRQSLCNLQMRRAFIEDFTSKNET
jgi:hypothetical protein